MPKPKFGQIIQRIISPTRTPPKTGQPTEDKTS